MATNVILDTTMASRSPPPYRSKLKLITPPRVKSSSNCTTTTHPRHARPHTKHPDPTPSLTPASTLDLPELRRSRSARLLQPRDLPPHHPELHAPDRRPHRHGPWRELRLRREVRGRDPRVAEAHRGGGAEHGEQRTEYQWLPGAWRDCCAVNELVGWIKARLMELPISSSS